MEPLIQTIYDLYPRKTAPDRAEKAIWKALKWLQKEEDMPLLPAIQRLAEATSLYRLWWEDRIKKEGETSRTYIPHPASWYNGGDWKEADKYRLDVPKRGFMAEADAQELWSRIEDTYGIPWGDKRYWGKKWTETWNNLPAPVRAELSA